MDWQQLASLGIVGVAAFLLLRPLVRPRPRAACGSAAGGCACSGAGGPVTKGSITFRARKGERPQVIVKMS